MMMLRGLDHCIGWVRCVI